MTLIGGLHHDSGLVVFADTEETEGASKHPINKLVCHDLFGDWKAMIGGAGDGSVVDNAVMRLGKKFAAIKPYDEDRVMEAVEEVLRVVHEKYIWPNPVSEGMSLIIGISHGSDRPTLIKTSQLTPSPQHIHAFIGIGRDIATYFADRLHDRHCSEEEAIAIAALILREASEAATNVSGATLYCLKIGGGFSLKSRSKVQLIWESLPDFDKHLSEYGALLKAAATKDDTKDKK